MSKDPKRRIVVDGDRPKAVPKALNLESLLSDAMTIIANELSSYRAKTDRGIYLDLKEARAVQGYMTSLAQMHKAATESAEKQRKELLEHLSDKELLEVAQKQLKDDEEVIDVKPRKS